MNLSDFDFILPESLIATTPANPRDSSKMLVVPGCHHSGESRYLNFADRKISDIAEFLKPGDVLVLNDTKVIPARLVGKSGTAKIEVTLHKKIKDNIWKAFAKPQKKLKDEFIIADDFSAKVLEKGEGEVTLNFGDCDLYKFLEKYGAMPLPPYMRVKEKRSQDKQNYQTVFASKEGAVAAPTAGLHFTPELLERIKSKGVKIEFVTLHVGAGTFLPVKVGNIKDHKMHSEEYEIGKEAAENINSAKKNGGRVVAVGTTALRTLESVADEKGALKEARGDTEIFITPGYKFKCVDILLTNFHLPKSTLFMLVSAFSGLDKMKAAYQHAIKNNYRFYSYGDCCLLLRK